MCVLGAVFKFEIFKIKLGLKGCNIVGTNLSDFKLTQLKAK